MAAERKMSKRSLKATLFARWKHWGVGFNVEPCDGPVDLETLLVDTARGLSAHARLFVMAVTWLAQHHRIVDVERLAKLAEPLVGRESACLGLLLETADGFIPGGAMGGAIARCHALNPPEPLYAGDAKPPALRQLAMQTADERSCKWGLWAAPLGRLKSEAIRPASWIARHNRSFLLRGLLKGDVRSKVMIALLEQGLRDVSEVSLTRLAGCTRRGMHLALDSLERAGLITRRRRGRGYRINPCETVPSP